MAHITKAMTSWASEISTFTLLYTVRLFVLDGSVQRSPKKGFGQRVVLRVGCTNYYMYFGHLSQINVAAGQKLKAG